MLKKQDFKKKLIQALAASRIPYNPLTANDLPEC